MSYWGLLLVKISARLNNILGSKGPEKPKRGLDVESIQKTLKIFNFTTTNAILMKLATDISTGLSFGKTLGHVTHKVQDRINKKTHKISQRVFGRNFD